MSAHADDMRQRIQAIMDATGPAGHRLLIGEFVEHWLRVEDAVNIAITRTIQPGHHFQIFHEQFLPEISISQRLGLIRELARARDVWPAVKPIHAAIHALNLRRNKLVHRPAVFHDPSVPVHLSGYPGQAPTDLDELRDAVHEANRLAGELGRAFA